jgi:hypothetical protein
MADSVSPRSASRSLKPRRGWLITIAILLVVAAIALLLLGRFLSFGPASGFFGQPFHDALGQFSTTVPDGWKVTGGTGGQHPVLNGVPIANEEYAFQDQQKGNTGAAIFVSVLLESNPSCREVPGQSIAPPYGVRAVVLSGSEPHNGMYISFETKYALFSIWVSVPTASGFEMMGMHIAQPTPTVTDPTTAQNQAQSIISSLQVTGSC